MDKRTNECTYCLTAYTIQLHRHDVKYVKIISCHAHLCNCNVTIPLGVTWTELPQNFNLGWILPRNVYNGASTWKALTGGWWPTCSQMILKPRSSLQTQNIKLANYTFVNLIKHFTINCYHPLKLYKCKSQYHLRTICQIQLSLKSVAKIPTNVQTRACLRVVSVIVSRLSPCCVCVSICDICLFSYVNK